MTVAKQLTVVGAEPNPQILRRSQISLNFTPYYGIDPNYGPSSMHPGGSFHLLGDGSVRFIVNEISVANYVALCTREGEEVINDVDW